MVSNVYLGARARNYRALLTAIATEPGNDMRMLSVACFALALTIEHDITYALVTVGATVITLLTLGFLAWRHWGG